MLERFLHSADEGFSKDRFAAFTDGAFAVAITLLIVDFRVPEIPHVNWDRLDEFPRQLQELRTRRSADDPPRPLHVVIGVLHTVSNRVAGALWSDTFVDRAIWHIDAANGVLRWFATDVCESAVGGRRRTCAATRELFLDPTPRWARLLRSRGAVGPTLSIAVYVCAAVRRAAGQIMKAEMVKFGTGTW